MMQQEQPGFCSLCFTHIASVLHFPAHALICAGKKRATREPDEGEIRRMILEDRVDDVRTLLENDAVPRALISIQYARSVEMCRLLLEHGADRFEYVGKGQVALEVAGRYFNFREFFPRGDEKARVYVAKLVQLRDEHYAKHGDGEHMITFVLSENVHKWELPVLGPKLVPYHGWKADEDIRSFLREMLWNGFFLANDQFEREVESACFLRYDAETSMFWQRRLNILHNPYSLSYWKTGPLAVFIKQTQRSPESFPMLMFGQHHLIYKNSVRAKTDMSMFRSADSKVIAEPSVENMIAVTRYAEGMSRGLFYEEDPTAVEKYCGTFYYFEPESRVFLKYGKAFRAPDKREAYFKLTGRNREQRERFETLILKRVANDPNFDLHLTPSQFRRLVTHTSDELMNKYWVTTKPYSVKEMTAMYDKGVQLQDEREFYAAHLLNLYAFQDDYDQPLCNAARAQGYDIVILERMVGSRQLVTEVLDTRSREESIQNLHFLEV